MQEFAENQDVIVATEVANSMGVNPYEITVDNELASKFKDITDYMKDYSDRNYLLQKLSRGMSKEDAVNHVWRYVGLRKEHSQAREKFEDISNELRKYE